MTQYDWSTAPTVTKAQIEQWLQVTQITLRDNLLGAYLHGSLAMGCFTPQRGDIDLVVLTSAPLSVEVKRATVLYLLKHSRNPHPIEVLYLAQPDLLPWQFPTTVDLDYSEARRANLQAELAGDDWRGWNEARGQSVEVAARLAEARLRGVVLAGPPAKQALPEIPDGDYRAALRAQFDRAAAALAGQQRTDHAILGMCRVWHYQATGATSSVDEAGAWALETLLPQHRPVVAEALAVSRGQAWRGTWQPEALVAFSAYLRDVVALSR